MWFQGGKVCTYRGQFIRPLACSPVEAPHDRDATCSVSAIYVGRSTEQHSVAGLRMWEELLVGWTRRADERNWRDATRQGRWEAALSR